MSVISSENFIMLQIKVRKITKYLLIYLKVFYEK